MNKTTLTIAVTSVGTLLAVGSASADFQGFSIDEVENGMAGLTTYRVYADLEAGDQLDTVFGDGVDELLITSTTSFYQNQFGGYGTPSAALFDFFPSLEFDSFVTIGLLDDAGDAMLNIGIDWTDFEDNGGDIWTDNGTWFATPDEPQVFEDGGRVIIGQFTSDGDVTGTVSLHGKNEDLTNWQHRSVTFSTIPAPSAIALLGLAGVAARRRRK